MIILLEDNYFTSMFEVNPFLSNLTPFNSEQFYCMNFVHSFQNNYFIKPLMCLMTIYHRVSLRVFRVYSIKMFILFS